MTTRPDTVFRSFESPKLTLPNRIVMAPMTRAKAIGGVSGEDVATYYARRAAAGVGLIVTEGTWIEHPAASNEVNVPRFYGDDALAGWRAVVEAVHAEGGKIAPQLWHVGLSQKSDVENLYSSQFERDVPPLTPSGFIRAGDKVAEPSDPSDIESAVAAYGKAARTARELGFDALELHGAHGYAIDQFFWHETNHRSDEWGGRTLGQRARFGVEVVRACRREAGEDFPIIFRFSQWKLQDYEARLANTPEELGTLLQALCEAGVDIFHASQRRFWEPAFAGSDLNLAGWAQRLTGKPAISVGSVGLSTDLLDALVDGQSAEVTDVEALVQRMEADEFDLIAVGRALIADAEWPQKLRQDRLQDAVPYNKESLITLD
ncbi:NADH:flavin oxidoreductase [Croceicoccus mobilis]|uniref:12-oxophytodienoate reductase n=1 Tax=Croceicoccus mobilis TaxID=1703339 RepID=A0A916ZBC3_9SPHN|nr:NADH:flavin oxidoreductase [Croceicoccus mobilis]GGD84696.1 12-oxophytodienoate reductase [Croceicoccus mobilis]